MDQNIIVPLVLIGWGGICALVALTGRDKRIGYWGVFAITFFTGILSGLLVGLLSKTVDKEKTDTRKYQRVQDIHTSRSIINSAVELYKRKDYLEAIEKVKSALNYYPDNAIAHFNLACLYSLMRKDNLIVSHLNKAINLGYDDYRNIETNDDLAYARTLDDWHTFFKFDNSIDGTTQLLAQQQITDYNKTHNNITGSKALINEAIALYKKKNYREAIKNIKNALVIYPNNPIAHYNLACLYSLTRDDSLIFKHLSKAVYLGYGIFENFETSEDLAYARTLGAWSEFIQSRYTYNDGIDHEDNQPVTHTYYTTSDFNSSKTLIAEAIELYSNKDYSTAIEKTKNALQFYPDNYSAHFNLACLYSLTRKDNLIFSHLSKAVLLGYCKFGVLENNEDLTYTRSLDRWSEFARSGYRNGIVTQPSSMSQIKYLNPSDTKRNSSRALIGEAIRFYKNEDYIAAIERINKALEYYPNNSIAHINLACLYSLTKNKNLMFCHLSKAVDLGYGDFERIETNKDLEYARSLKGWSQFARNAYRFLA